ncbi:response regulator [bacterium]|nr:response regulator [bacterium]
MDSPAISAIQILLVEDNKGDIELTQEKLRESKVLNELHVVQNGIEAISFLRKEGKYLDSVTPDLILLDLNLPKKSGLEVLKDIKSDEVLHKIPVVILTSSAAEIDIARSYDLKANAYVVKPVDLYGFGEIIRGIDHFWLTVVKYPTAG